jgi:hypothetical protein
MADDDSEKRPKQMSEPHDGGTPSIASLEGENSGSSRPSFNDPLPRAARDETQEERSPSRRPENLDATASDPR